MTTINKAYPGTPFSITYEKLEQERPYWNNGRIAIFRDGIYIGEYERNYHSYGPATFYPFLLNNVWYALYSSDYTATRVAKLDNGFEDWCGEDAYSCGFCPTEYFVPAKIEYTYTAMNSKGEQSKHQIVRHLDCRIPEDKIDEFFSTTQEEKKENPTISWCNWGLISGCVWGDDNSWKIRYIDLSKVEQKELIITERFGYWEMPSHLKLRQCVNIVSDNYLYLTGEWLMDMKKKKPNPMVDIEEDDD